MIINILSTLLLVVGIAVAFFALDKFEKFLVAKAKARREKRNGADENGTAPQQ